MDRRQYLKHFMIILSGSGAAQIANLLSYPILARLYTPEAFGRFAIFVAAAAIPSAIASGRFDRAIPIAPRAGRFGIFWLCLLISAAAGLISIPLSAIYWWFNARGGELVLLPVLLGLSVFLSGATSTMMFYLMRHEHYRASSSSQVVRTGGAVLCQLILGVTAAASGRSLILGFVFGQFGQMLYLAAVYARSGGAPKFRRRDVGAMFRRYQRQVMVDIPSTLLSVVSLNAMTFVVAALYGQRIVGFYSLGYRLAALPLQLINDSLAQTFFQKAARAQEHKGHFWEEMKFGLLTSGIFSFIVLLGILFLSYPFITRYLGPEWAPTAHILIMLAPLLAMAGVTQSIATSVFILNRPHWRLIHIVGANLIHLAVFAAAAEFHLPLRTYLITISSMLTAEWGLYLIFLIFAAHRSSKPLSAAALEKLETREIARLIDNGNR